MYKTSFTVVFVENSKKAYNWLNGEYIEFDDFSHPFLKILTKNTATYEKFKHDNSYEDFNWLLKNKFIAQDMETITKSIENDLKEKQRLNELNLTLLPADNACNLRCKYCYEDHSLDKHMTQEDQSSIIKFIRNYNPSKLHIEFFGGEPLLNKSFILNISKILRDLSESNNFSFSASMTTNGYFLDLELFKNLLKNNIKSYQITLDGLENDHNSLRPKKNGGNSYNQIFKNLKMIAKTDLAFSIMIRVNFNNETASAEKRKKVLSIFKEHFFNDHRFSFIFRPIGDYASANKMDINNKNSILCNKPNANNLQQLFEEEALNMKLNISEMQLYLGNGSASCYAGKKNNLIIDSNLNVKKCTVALDDPINTVGSINENGEFTQNDNWQLWTENNLFKEKKCYSCFFISQCQSNNCRLKNIKNGKLICPPLIIDHKLRITDKILSYIETFREEL